MVRGLLFLCGAGCLVCATEATALTYVPHLIVGALPLYLVGLMWLLGRLKDIKRPAWLFVTAVCVYIGVTAGAVGEGGLGHGAMLYAVGFGAIGCAVGIHIELHYPPTVSGQARMPNSKCMDESEPQSWKPL